MTTENFHAIIEKALPDVIATDHDEWDADLLKHDVLATQCNTFVTIRIHDNDEIELVWWSQLNDGDIQSETSWMGDYHSLTGDMFIGGARLHAIRYYERTRKAAMK